MRKTKQARNASIKNEVAVVFLDKHVRDVVASHGKNLSSYTDSNGLPTAGMRLEYPSYLGRIFRDLDWYGREMRRRHGPGTKRNIKFQDDENTMYIDVCLPAGDHWHRIPHEEAKKYRDKIMAERAKEARLSLEGPPTRIPVETGANRTPLGTSSRRNEPSGWGGSSGHCLLYTSPSPRDRQKSRMPSSA